MLLKKTFKICLFILTLAFSLQLYNHALAGDCAEKRDKGGTPTNPGNSEYPPGWLCQCPPAVPFEFDNDSTPDTITSGGSIDIYVTGGCPPFTYEVSGNGYTWNGNGSSSYKSNNRNEQLNCEAGS